MNGAERIALERARQVSEEGYDEEHDDDHTDGQIAMAAACYAAPERIYIREDYASSVSFDDPWPWDAYSDARPCNGNVLTPEKATKAQRIRLLEKAGALIAAEIDRLLRTPEEACPHNTAVAGICTDCGYNTVDGTYTNESTDE